MVYKEYLNSARKHKHTCYVIKEEIESILKGEKEDKNGDLKKLILNLYYLSGYIIECSIKYGIYSYAEFDKNKDVRALKTDEINFNDHIKHHRFSRYVEKFNQVCGGVTLIDDDKEISKEVKSLYDNWDAEIRYLYKNIPVHFKSSIDSIHVKKFNEKANEVFNYIEKNIV